MGAWGIKALERDEGLDVLDILKNEYVPEHPVMDLGEMIELMKEEVMLGSDFSQIDFLFDNTAMALAELYFQWKDNGKLDYDHEEAIWDKVTGFTASKEALAFLPEAEKKEAVKKSCQRTFQALRIDINSEFEVLYAFLDKLPGALKPGGRAAILTFHSGEDRLVKKAFKEGLKAGIYSEINQDVIRPSAEECAKNGRAKSTKLRWAVKAQE